MLNVDENVNLKGDTILFHSHAPCYWDESIAFPQTTQVQGF